MRLSMCSKSLVWMTLVLAVAQNAYDSVTLQSGHREDKRVVWQCMLGGQHQTPLPVHHSMYTLLTNIYWQIHIRLAFMSAQLCTVCEKNLPLLTYWIQDFIGIMVHCSPQYLPLKMAIGRILSPKGRKLFIMDDRGTKLSTLARARGYCRL